MFTFIVAFYYEIIKFISQSYNNLILFFIGKLQNILSKIPDISNINDQINKIPDMSDIKSKIKDKIKPEPKIEDQDVDSLRAKYKNQTEDTVDNKIRRYLIYAGCATLCVAIVVIT
jgi:hypothetical protein